MHSILISDVKEMEGRVLRHKEKLQLVRITLDYHLQHSSSNFQKEIMEKFCLDCQSTKKCERLKTRMKTSSPGRRRCRPNADVVARALKFAVFVKKHPSHAAPVVARAHALSPARIRTSSPGRKRRCKSAEVWGVCEKTPLPRGTRRRTGADVVTRTHAFSCGRRRYCPSVHVVARGRTLSPDVDGSGRPTTPVCGRRRCRSRRPRVRPNLRGYKRPRLPFSPHFPSIRSFLAWTCPPAAPCKNLTDRTLAFFSYCVICLCEPHKRTVHHLHILDHERP